MRILVTGGAGFIGSHLCEFLLNKGHEVICLDNFFTGRKKNIHHLLNNQNFELIRHDVTMPIFLEVDQIYNLACPAAPVHYQFNPIKTIKCSTLGTLNMLGLAKRTKARILQASTSEVYGDPEIHPQPESYVGAVDPISIRSCYDEGKRVAEAMCMDYHRQNNVDIRIARIFNTFGPRTQLNDGRVMSNFIIQALSNKPITIYGDGSQTRSFCYVSDLVNGLYSLMNGNTIGPVNLGNPKEYTMKQLAEVIIKLTGSKSEITYHPLPQADPKQRRPDISLAKEKLDWEPKFDVEQGILHTIEYFKHELGIH
jgi:UDP-glucuronate decarboxylase